MPREFVAFASDGLGHPAKEIEVHAMPSLKEREMFGRRDLVGPIDGRHALRNADACRGDESI